MNKSSDKQPGGLPPTKSTTRLLRSQLNYLVVGCRTWHTDVFDTIIKRLDGRWRYLSDRSQLNVENLKRWSIHKIFFLHWSYKVAPEIFSEYECICFHMTDVPYGRGGSPLQNLILRGHSKTMLTALKMNGEMDAGPVYLKAGLSLSGNANQILRRATVLSAAMIKKIIQQDPVPVPQIGVPVIFKRRSPQDSALPKVGGLQEFYDFIRMLDGEGYPPAFLEHAGFRIEFSRAKLIGNELQASVHFRNHKA